LFKKNAGGLDPTTHNSAGGDETTRPHHYDFYTYAYLGLMIELEMSCLFYFIATLYSLTLIFKIYRYCRSNQFMFIKTVFILMSTNMCVSI
jgi:hypothetical protein